MTHTSYDDGLRPMLGAKTTPELLVKAFKEQPDYLASAKLDGIRALIINGTVVSRTLKPIRNKHVQKLFGNRPELEGLDGELIVGSPTDPNCFRTTTSGVMSEHGEPDVTFYVFDYINRALGFEWRYHFYSHHLEDEVRDPRIRSVRQIPIGHIERAQEQAVEAVKAGYEGLILRSPDRPYKFGRSTIKEGGMLKIKEFQDGEAKIIDCQELLHNLNEAKKDALGYTERSSHKDNKAKGEILGSLVVRDLQTGVEFKIGTGFDFQQRVELWEASADIIGKIVTYTSFGYGAYDKPRFPVFKGFRDKEDLTV